MFRPTSSESQLKQKIADWLTANRIFHRRFAGTPYSKSGVPDFFLLLPGGRACWIECKRPGRYKNPWIGCQRDSPAQFHFLTSVNLHGGLGLCVDSLEAVVAELSPLVGGSGTSQP